MRLRGQNRLTARRIAYISETPATYRGYQTPKVHLVVTSPPYWTLKEYAAGNEDQMGHFKDYERFLAELDRVWRECERVLVGGGESVA